MAITTAVSPTLARNTNQDEEGKPVQLGGHPESAPGEAAGATESSEPAGRPEEDEEEGKCRSRENSPEMTRQSYSEAVTDALLPNLTQEGEETLSSNVKDQLLLRGI